MDCLENLPKCKARCCKFMGFTHYNSMLSTDLEKYYNAHGAKVIRKKNIAIVLIKVQCKHLCLNDTCGVQSSDKFQVCHHAYEKNRTGNIFMPSCIYPPQHDSIVLTEEDLGDWV